MRTINHGYRAIGLLEEIHHAVQLAGRLNIRTLPFKLEKKLWRFIYNHHGFTRVDKDAPTEQTFTDLGMEPGDIAQVDNPVDLD